MLLSCGMIYVFSYHHSASVAIILLNIMLLLFLICSICVFPYRPPLALFDQKRTCKTILVRAVHMKTGDVAQWLVHRNSNPKTLGSIPRRGRVRDGFLSLQVNSCADLFVPDPLSCVWHTPKFMRRFKIPYPSVLKE